MHAVNAQTLIRHLARASTAPATRLDDGSLLLLPPESLARWMGWAAPFGIVVAVASAVLAVQWPGALLGIPLGVLTTVVTRRNLRLAVLLTDSGIGVRQSSGAHRMLAWDAIADLQFSRVTWTWTLIAQGGAKLRFPALLRGGVEFPVWLRHHVPAARWRRLGPAIERWQHAMRYAGASTRVAPPAAATSTAPADEPTR